MPVVRRGAADLWTLITVLLVGVVACAGRRTAIWVGRQSPGFNAWGYEFTGTAGVQYFSNQVYASRSRARRCPAMERQHLDQPGLHQVDLTHWI
jgi:hypothetical protein